jgi:hypothetical protein
VRADARRLLLVLLFALVTLSLQAQPFPKLADEIPPLAPPLPEVSATFFERYPLVRFALPGLVVGAALGLWQALRNRKKVPPPLPSPVAQARTALLVLQAHPEDGATLSAVSKVLRNYLINKFWVRPEEMTTTEFCAALVANKDISAEISSKLVEFLRGCDERKFSPAANTTPLNAASRALALVEMAEAPRTMIVPAGEPPALRS